MLLKALGVELTGEISFSAYLETYDNISDLIDWYEFFNENNYIQAEKKQSLDKNKLDQALGKLQDEVLDCMI